MLCFEINFFSFGVSKKMYTYLFRVLLFFMFIPFSLIALPVAEYGIGKWSAKRTGLGHHRAKVKVENNTDAVAVMIPWRRRDQRLQDKAILVYDSKNQCIKNALPVEVTQDKCRLIFQPKSGKGEYFIYYMPYVRKGIFASETYTLPKKTASKEWLVKHSLEKPQNYENIFSKLPQAKLIAIESNDKFHSFYPMEVCATPSEVASMKAKLPHDAPFYTFPELRGRDIRMLYRLPYWWVKKGPEKKISGTARPDEYYPFQVGVWAANGKLTNLKVEFDDLKNSKGQTIPAANLNCFNTAGVNYEGQAFVKKATIYKNQVQPLWIGVQVPKNALGKYMGTMRICTDQGIVPINLQIQVSGEKIAQHGDNDLNNLSRLRWLNSRIGINDKVLPGFKEIQVNNKTLEFADRSVTYQTNGLPEHIKSNGIEILASPVSLIAESGGAEYLLSGIKSTLKRKLKTLVEFDTAAKFYELDASVKAVLEQDGCLQYDVYLKTDKKITLDNLKLNIPLRRKVAKYLVGMRHKGGLRDKNVNWKWGKNNLTNSIWIGDVKAGIQLKLQEDNDSWNIWGNPAQIDSAWNNKGRGGCKVSERGDVVQINAYCGKTVIEPGKALRLRFRLLITPFKKIAPNHWNSRTTHFNWNISERGNTIINMFHQEPMMPYINYPFTHMGLMKRFLEKHKYYYRNGSLTYYLNDKFNPKQGTLHIKTTANFNYKDRKPGNDKYNHHLAVIDLGKNVGKLKLFWSADDCGIRAYFLKVDGGKKTIPIQIIGKQLKSRPGDKIDIVLSWGKKLSLYVNGRLTGCKNWEKQALNLKPVNPSLKLYGPKFVYKEIRLDSKEYNDSSEDSSSYVDTILYDKFSQDSKLNLPASGEIKLDVKVNFDPTEREKGNAKYNRKLMDIVFGQKGRIILYWNVDDNGMRLLVQKGDRTSGTYPVILKSTSPWKRGQLHNISIAWGKELTISIDGKILARETMNNFVSQLLKEPCSLNLLPDGILVNSLKICSDNPEFKPVEFDTVYRKINNHSKGGGAFYSDYALGWNGLYLFRNRFNTRFQMYYTIRELSNHCREIWAFRSLGSEIYSVNSGGIYDEKHIFHCGKGGGYPWLQEHLDGNYIPAWRTTTLGEDFCAAISTNSTSRLVNYYLEGLKYLLKNVGIDGLYLDGIGYGRDVMKRVARTMSDFVGKKYRMEFHCCDLYPKLKISVMNHNMEHLPYLTKLWLGEGYNYNMPPDYYLIEISGIPFGITGEMLNYKNGGNPYRGMIFGMGGRKLSNIKYLWDFWDYAELEKSEMIGYWDEQCPVRTNNPEVYATVYRKADETIVAVAQWSNSKRNETNKHATLPILKEREDIIELGAKFTNLVELRQNVLASPQTQTIIYSSATAKGLKFHVEAFSPGKITNNVKKRDGDIWEDDSFEIFIRPDLYSSVYYQFVGNSAGFFYDGKNRDSRWNGKWNYKTYKTDKGWAADLFVPYSTFKMLPLKTGSKIGFNFARNGTGHGTVWKSMNGNFHQPDQFSILTIGRNATRQNMLEYKLDASKSFKLKIDFAALGLDPDKTEVIAPLITGFQASKRFNVNSDIPIENAKGWLFILKKSN
jgi:hypothetical protein